MPQPNLQGLNVVHAAPPAAPVSDAQDLLSAPPFSDFTAQLDLWTNLAFESDEPLDYSSAGKGKRKLSASQEEQELEEEDPAGLASHDGHENVVHPQGAPASQFDLNALLSGFGIDPYLLPSAQLNTQSQPAPPQSHPQSATAPTLAQLLALHAAQTNAYPLIQQQLPSGDSTAAAHPPHPVPAAPPTKRARTRKNSVSFLDNSEPASPEASTTGAYTDGSSSGAAPMSASEDKRRRNTAASARFRLKKKEREAALEQRAKELEGRVSELERECEGLRRENGWLKGLVVGVTGAGAQQQQQPVRRREDGDAGVTGK
ncbi:hypothetical protein SERLA73DRAFT_180850 [Serpula lacrymans var. lacrymans S7.3]|uniref:BZIP domain-containing protein n=2 Tax=Serpula lacrymans var. lacrymans TaxID=341189 RepID=F8PWK1_SERL3|nr:uncharacterized protein SERLADRAFT_466641 [Serpula lacrymans var. lacrymans S7.9]EGO00325.1 hypothetical protein SERLA73DRAFT_180850 [Serpula lacrymans var. lacrymans S7.3]EGO25884.1 hypothetical protein SERLADRAFT_466641 [Serpula lacrymans var. lacrymans S7.9]